ncbi:MAG: alpha/beta fold hydrolase [Nitrospirae bacterium]|nr:MAG: alpha/beta fold hydrolase [Nitrospirota bacterium]
MAAAPSGGAEPGHHRADLRGDPGLAIQPERRSRPTGKLDQRGPPRPGLGDRRRESRPAAPASARGPRARVTTARQDHTAMIEQSLTFQDPSGHRVSAILATPDQSTDRLVVLCHGFLSNKNSTTNKVLTARLAELGIGTLRFDFFGQGESDGPFERITVSLALEQALAALTLATSKGYRRIGLIGSSFGGLVAILAAAQIKTLACVGLKCPVPDFEEMLRLEFGPNGIEEWKRTGTIPNLTGRHDRVRLHFAFYEDCAAHKGYEAAKAITAPTVIVQGDQDEYVPLHQSRRLLESLAGEKQLTVLPGADHSFTKGEDFRRMTTLLSDWMVTHLSADRGERR